MTEDTTTAAPSADDERKAAEERIARLINESIEEAEAGAECVDGDELLAMLRQKYGPKA